MIALARLKWEDTARVLHLQLGAGPERFVHPIVDMVDERGPGVQFHVIERAGEVGVFKIDHPVAEPAPYMRAHEAMLRGFLIGAQYQGQGKARGAMVGFGAHMAAGKPAT